MGHVRLMNVGSYEISIANANIETKKFICIFFLTAKVNLYLKVNMFMNFMNIGNFNTIKKT